MLLLALALVACLLLVVAEFGDLNQIQILTVTRPASASAATTATHC